MFVAYRSIQAGLAAFLPYSAPLSHPFLTQPGRLFLFFPPPSLSLPFSPCLSLSHTHTLTYTLIHCQRSSRKHIGRWRVQPYSARCTRKLCQAQQREARISRYVLPSLAHVAVSPLNSPSTFPTYRIERMALRIMPFFLTVATTVVGSIVLKMNEALAPMACSFALLRNGQCQASFSLVLAYTHMQNQ